MNPVEALVERWRDRAKTFRSHGAEGQARTLETVAAELHAALREAAEEELTLAEAMEASGLSDRRLRELVANGELENVGRRGSPRYRRGDLPRRRAKARGEASAAYDPHADAERLIRRLNTTKGTR